MKKYFELLLVMSAVSLVSCAREGYVGPQDSNRWGGMMHYGFGYGYGGVLMWIIFLIVVGFLIYFAVRSQRTKGQPPTPHESHLDILKKRYAKGEITREDYERMKKDLQE